MAKFRETLRHARGEVKALAVDMAEIPMEFCEMNTDVVVGSAQTVANIVAKGLGRVKNSHPIVRRLVGGGLFIAAAPTAPAMCTVVVAILVTSSLVNVAAKRLPKSVNAL